MERIPQMTDLHKNENLEGQKRVRIAWKVKETGATGHGEYIEKASAESWLTHLAEEHPDMEHWLEEETDSENLDSKSEIETTNVEDSISAESSEGTKRYRMNDTDTLLQITTEGKALVDKETMKRMLKLSEQENHFLGGGIVYTVYEVDENGNERIIGQDELD